MSKEANLAASKGNLKLLEIMKVLPTVEGANAACGNGHLAVLKWLAGKGIYPDVSGANNAAWHGRVDILEWLLSKGIRPTHVLKMRRNAC